MYAGRKYGQQGYRHFLAGVMNVYSFSSGQAQQPTEINTEGEKCTVQPPNMKTQHSQAR